MSRKTSPRENAAALAAIAVLLFAVAILTSGLDVSQKLAALGALFVAAAIVALAPPAA